MDPCLTRYFIVKLFRESDFLLRDLAIVLPSKSKLSRKLYCFNTIDESIEILKISGILKNFN